MVRRFGDAEGDGFVEYARRAPRGRLCRVRTSNAGRCLISGIANPSRARRMAAGLMSEACLSLEVRAGEKKVVLTNPVLPEFLRKVQIKGLRIGEASLDLSLTRYRHNVGINVLRREGQVSVVTVK